MALPVAIGIFKVISVANASSDAYKTFHNEKATRTDKIVAVFNGVFVFVQVGDVVVKTISTVCSNVKVGTTIAAGVADCVRTSVKAVATRIKKRGDWKTRDLLAAIVKCGSVVAFRSYDTVDVAGKLLTCPLEVARFAPLMEAADIGMKVTAVAGLGITLPSTKDLAFRAYHLYLSKRANAKTAERDSKRAGEDVASLMLTHLTPDQANEDIALLLSHAASLDRLTKIPYSFACDARLQRLCGISGRSIRMILIPNLSESQRIGPFARLQFDHEAVLARIKIDPNRTPDGWPNELLPPPLTIHHFKVDSSRQADIDHALTEIISELQEALTSR